MICFWWRVRWFSLYFEAGRYGFPKRFRVSLRTYTPRLEQRAMCQQLERLVAFYHDQEASQEAS